MSLIVKTLFFLTHQMKKINIKKAKIQIWEISDQIVSQGATPE